MQFIVRRVVAGLVALSLSQTAFAQTSELAQFNAEELRILQADLARTFSGNNLLEDDQVNQYLRDLYAQLDSSTKIFLTAIPSSIPNATAYWGGVVFVNAGMITFAHSEAALLGVVAHELAHVELEHFERIDENMSLIQALTSGALLIGILAGGGDAGKIATGAVGLSKSQEYELRRRYEREADRKAVRLLAASGYSVDDYSALLVRLDSGDEVPGYAATHPFSPERVAIVKTLERGQTDVAGTADTDLAYWLIRERIIHHLGYEANFSIQAPTAIRDYVVAYRQLLQSKNSVSAYELLQDKQDQWLVALLLADYASFHNDPARAIDYIEAALEFFPNNIALYKRLLELYLANRNFKEARYHITSMPPELRETETIASMEARLWQQQNEEYRYRVAVAYVRYYSGSLREAQLQVTHARKLPAAKEVSATTGRLEALEGKLQRIKRLLAN